MKEIDLSQTDDTTIIDYIKGKPDRPRWRAIFAENGYKVEDEDFISIGGKIYTKPKFSLYSSKYSPILVTEYNP